MHYPLTDIQAEFEINRPVRYQINAERNYFHRRTDGLYDRRTDSRRVQQQYVVFFEKREKLLRTKIDKATCYSLRT